MPYYHNIAYQDNSQQTWTVENMTYISDTAREDLNTGLEKVTVPLIKGNKNWWISDYDDSGWWELL